MAVAASQREAKHLRALVDMGSNGIRFSISSLQPPTERIMPTLYQHRVGISLYDAQYSSSGERIPIDEKTIGGVCKAFTQFKRTCQDFAVPGDQITVLATEATRTAVNSEEFRGRIKKAVGWDVTMLAKEEEGRVGAMGVASSLPEVAGLVMDLGGGSTQLSWLIQKADREGVQMPEKGAVSMPYGAAAMMRRLTEAEGNGTTGELKAEIKKAVTEAYHALKVPSELEDAAKSQGGFTLYLSGGGFRGWGYVLMSQHRVKPYPIPVINGFKASRKEFLDTKEVQEAAAATLDDKDDGNKDEIFRVSDRRASQVPAVAMLVNVLAEALPQINEVRFCQGGVREGFLYSTLPSAIKSQNPLVVATQPFDSPTSSELMTNLILSAFPPGSTAGAKDDYKSIFTPTLLDAFLNLIYYHCSHSKDLQGTAALRSTTSGVLAGVHGVLHESRALIALLLCARWGGDVPPSDEMFKKNMEALIESPFTLWWINYIGAVAALLATVYPGGVVRDDAERVRFDASWGTSKKGKTVLNVRVAVAEGTELESLEKELEKIEKVGKKKKWIGGKEGAGHKVKVEIVKA